MNFISIDARKALADLDDPRAPIPIKRTVAADLVAALIDWLDLLDGDPDLEPSLAGFDGLSYHKAEVDLEDDGLSRELDTADDEPSLGWTDMESRFGRLAAPTFDPDREEDVQDEPHDPDPDLEHSLGWAIAHQSDGQQPAMLAAGLMGGMEGDREADYIAGSVCGISAGVEAGPEREQGV